jgi:hypothetical protein
VAHKNNGYSYNYGRKTRIHENLKTVNQNRIPGCLVLSVTVQAFQFSETAWHYIGRRNWPRGGIDSRAELSTEDQSGKVPDSAASVLKRSHKRD